MSDTDGSEEDIRHAISVLEEQQRRLDLDLSEPIAELRRRLSQLRDVPQAAEVQREAREPVLMIGEGFGPGQWRVLAASFLAVLVLVGLINWATNQSNRGVVATVPAQAVAPNTAVTPYTTGPTTVRIDPLKMTIVPSQPFSLQFHLDNVLNLAGFEVHLAFDPALLEVEKVSSGLVPADFIAEDQFDNKLGTIDYAVVQINKPAVSGSGTLLTIHFIAKAAGTSPISYRTNYPAAPAGIILVDPSGSAIPATLQPGSVTVATPTRVPGN